METLTPAQRVLVTIIVLALTVIAAALVLPWLSEQIDLRLLATPTPGPPSPTPAEPPTATAPAALLLPVVALLLRIC
jgi:hypothetical protein